MATTIAPPLTLEEFAQLPADAVRHEISEGELITMPPRKSLHTLVALAILEVLQTYLKQHGRARVIPEAGYVLLAIRSLLANPTFQYSPFRALPPRVRTTTSKALLRLSLKSFLRLIRPKPWT